MQLHYEIYPQDIESIDTVPVVIIPGLFGSGVNWRSFAKKLSQDYSVIVIDQRNHGRSPHADSHRYVDMVEDLRAFLDQRKLQKVTLCGHSMGGKVAMIFCLLYPERVAKLAVLDIAPVTYRHSHAPFLEELSKIELKSLGSRAQADRVLQPVIPDTPTRLFLLQSLIGTAGDYRWRLNLSVLHRYMPEIMGFPDELLTGLTNDCDTIFITGELSDYVRLEHHAKITQYFANNQFSLISGAGHWLHAEQPKQTLETLRTFLNK